MGTCLRKVKVGSYSNIGYASFRAAIDMSVHNISLEEAAKTSELLSMRLNNGELL